jgi:2-isopropylmalate synthase
MAKREQRRIEVLCTTFRDGKQQQGMNDISLEQALSIIERMAKLGTDYAELGFAGANGSVAQLIKAALELDLGGMKIAAFGRTRKRQERVAESPDIREIVRLGVPVAVIVAKSRLLDVKNSIDTDPSENLAMIRDSISYLKQSAPVAEDREVILDLEHAVDAFFGRVQFGRQASELEKAASRDYFLQVVETAIAVGADCLVVCDTNGGASPEEIAQMFDFLVANYPGVKFGIHCHNDCELAVANTRAAVFHGAVHVQGVWGGYGERCGNANLFSVISLLQLKDGFDIFPSNSLEQFTSFARQVAVAFNREQSDRAAFVGKLAFTTMAGMHGDSEGKDNGAYLHLEPKQVGNRKHIGVNSQSGFSNIRLLAEHLGISLNKHEVRQLADCYAKEIEEGRFEGANGSFFLACLSVKPGFDTFFTIEESDTSTLIDFNTGLTRNQAILDLFVHQSGQRAQHEVVVEKGEGQFDATFKALQKALLLVYPEIKEVKLKDYRVRAFGIALAGSAAKVRVTTEFVSADGHVWTTSGISAITREAEILALVDGFRYYLAIKRLAAA